MNGMDLNCENIADIVHLWKKNLKCKNVRPVKSVI